MTRDQPARHRVLIVGCGQIAGGFDAARSATDPPLTHAGAYLRHGGFELAACVEPDESRRLAFMQRFGVAEGFDDLAAVVGSFAPGHFAVASICSPTALHAAQLRALLALQPRLVFCEKPVTPTRAETAALAHEFEAAGIALAVNHNRRWAPCVQALRQELAAGEWGAVRSATGTYNKGVLNNGSHMLDLLHLLLGPLTLLHAGRPVADHFADDPSVPALLQTAQGLPVHLQTAHAGDGAVFELQLHTGACDAMPPAPCSPATACSTKAAAGPAATWRAPARRWPTCTGT
jgi:predicted dehydrogenase